MAEEKKKKCGHNNPDEQGNCYDCGIDQFVDEPTQHDLSDTPLPFSVFVTFKTETPSLEEMKIGGQISKEFFDLLGPDAEGFPECVASVTIKRKA